MRQNTNPFNAGWVAGRYARTRPRIHRQVVDRIRAKVMDTGPIDRALDVGCGTGLSTVPLREFVRAVFGMDLSAGMLGEASAESGVTYVRARAEEIPFVDGTFRLLTIGCAYHWCERQRFFTEAARILDTGGWVVVYDNGFLGQMQESAELTDWHQSWYLPRFPPPPRNPAFAFEDDCPQGFVLCGRDFTDEWFPMTRSHLVSYLTTQSGIVSAIEEQRVSLHEVETLLHRELAAFFPIGQVEGRELVGHFRFGGPISYLRVVDQATGEGTRGSGARSPFRGANHPAMK